MFENHFNFNQNDKETISDEIRKLVSQKEISSSQYNLAEENNYLLIWKKNLLKLSGNN